MFGYVGLCSAINLYSDPKPLARLPPPHETSFPQSPWGDQTPHLPRPSTSATQEKEIKVIPPLSKLGTIVANCFLNADKEISRQTHSNGEFGGEFYDLRGKFKFFIFFSKA